MPHFLYILYLFAMGACVGSFLNVVVWRLPRGIFFKESKSFCPQCRTPLSWRDNIPIFGWFMLRGRCRYCALPISFRYPSIEFLTAVLFAGYYVAFYMLHLGPYFMQFQPGAAGLPGKFVPFFSDNIAREWPIYVMSMWLLASLLAASLIDAELFIIPLQIPWICAIVGVVGHACFDRFNLPGHLIPPVGSPIRLIGLGGGIGFLVSLILYILRVIPQSFPKGEPAPEVDAIVQEKQKAPPADAPRGFWEKLIDLYRGEPTETQKKLMKQCLDRQKHEPAPAEEPEPVPPNMTPIQIRLEMLKELVFLLPILLGAAGLILLKKTIPSFAVWIDQMLGHDWLSALSGAFFGAMVGAGLVWGARILGTLWFGRIAMGLGDVHLMFGIGAIVGASQASLIFFAAPFMAIAVGLWGFITRKQRELPYGPYLSMATAVIMLTHAPIEAYLSPGFNGLFDRLRDIMGI